MFGHEVRGPLDILKKGWEADKRASESVISHELSPREHWQSLFELFKEHMSKIQQKHKSMA